MNEEKCYRCGGPLTDGTDCIKCIMESSQKGMTEEEIEEDLQKIEDAINNRVYQDSVLDIRRLD